MTTERILVLSGNDLEARVLAAIWRGRGLPVIELETAWGLRPDPGILPDKAITAVDEVVLVELPGDDLRARLGEAGKRVEVIDHHILWDSVKGRLDDRRHRLSSLEQGAWMIGTALPPWQRLVAANDRGYWPGLIACLSGKVVEPFLRDTPAWMADWRGLAKEVLPTPPRDAPAQEIEIMDTLAVVLAVRLEELACVLFPENPEFGPENRPVLDLLEQALEWIRRQSEKPDGGDLIWLSGGLSGGPDYCLARVPEDLFPVFGDALYLSRILAEKDFRTLRFLALCRNGKDGETNEGGGEAPFQRIFYSGPGEDIDIIVEILGAGYEGAFATLSVHAGGDESACYLDCEGPPDGDASLLEPLADAILDATLGVARPLLRWTTRFFQVLDYAAASPAVGEGASLKWTEEVGDKLAPFQPSEQERLYLLHHLQRFLCPESPESPDAKTFEQDRLEILSFSRVFGDDAPKLAITPGGGGGEPVNVPLKEALVHFCFNRLAILEWAFGDSEKAASPRDGGLWRELLAGWPMKDRGVRTIGQLLDFNFWARQCYSPFEGKTAHDRADITLVWPDKRGSTEERTLKFLDAVTNKAETPQGWFGLLERRLLGPFGLERSKLILDERARVLSCLVPIGQKSSRSVVAERERQLFARLCDVARSGDGYPYDPIFNRRVLNKISYRRFEDFGTLFGVDDHALVAYAYGDFAKEKLVGHMNENYRRLFLVGLFYQSVFHKFSKGIAALAKERLALDTDPESRNNEQRNALRDDVHELRTRFLGFANALWFDRISGQMQGIEIFELLTDRLALCAQYQGVRDELDRFDEIERIADEARATERRDRFSVLVGLIAGATAVPAVLGNTIQFPEKVLPWWGAVLLALFVGLVGARVSLRVSQQGIASKKRKGLFSILRGLF